MYNSSIIHIPCTSKFIIFDTSYLLNYNSTNVPSQETINSNISYNSNLNATEDASDDGKDFTINKYYKETNSFTNFTYTLDDYQFYFDFYVE